MTPDEAQRELRRQDAEDGATMAIMKIFLGAVIGAALVAIILLVI